MDNDATYKRALEQADAPLELVPIRLDMELENIKVRVKIFELHTKLCKYFDSNNFYFLATRYFLLQQKREAHNAGCNRAHNLRGSRPQPTLI